MPDLETVDLLGVEILSVGGPIHGVGSPPEGDFYTTADLQAMADAAVALAGELKAPAKIGHSDAQALAFNSELAPVTPGEMPKVGTLANQRVSDDGSKLLADIKKVPKKFAELIDAGAWDDRSIELSKVTSQKTGQVYDWVVTGLAWLGAKLPAVRTLGDVVALYENAGVELLRVIHYAEGSVVWDPAASFQALRDHVAEALNGPPTGGMNSPRYWVQDVDVVGSRALVGDYFNETYTDAWVIPFTRASDGSIKVAPSSDWTKAEQAWVEAARKNAQKHDPGSRRPAADTRPMKFSDEQRRKFAEATGLEAAKVTDEMLEGAGIAEEATPVVSDEQAKELAKTLGVEGEDISATKLLEAAKAKPKVVTETKESVYSEEDVRKLEERALAGERAEKKLYDMERDGFIKEAIVAGKFKPGQLEELRAMYDAGPEAARKFIQNSPTHDSFVTELGSDGDRYSIDEETKKAYEGELAAMVGLGSAEELL